jgi:hypothetical protein
LRSTATGNPEQIISGYLTDLKTAYKTFLKNAMRIFPSIPAEKIIKTIKGNISDSNSHRIIDQASKIAKLGEPKKPTTGSAAAQTTGSAAVPPILRTDTPTSVSVATGPANDFVKIVGHVMRSIIAAVASDPRSKPYMTGTLPTSFDDPPVHQKAKGTGTSVAETIHVPLGAAASSNADADDDDGDETDGDDEAGKGGAFLRRFHGHFNKSRKFVIEILEGAKTIDLSNGKRKELRVMWNVHQYTNDIYVMYKDTDPESKWKRIKLMTFSDASANYRSPSFAGKESVIKYLKDANPYEENIIKKADPSVIASEIESQTDKFTRALYATTIRKAMEWKEKKSDSAATSGGGGAEAQSKNVADAIAILVDKGLAQGHADAMVQAAIVKTGAPAIKMSGDEIAKIAWKDIDADDPSPTEIGTASVEEKGGKMLITWEKPDGTVQTFTTDELATVKSPRLKMALKAAGFPYEKYMSEGIDPYINPYQEANFV